MATLILMTVLSIGLAQSSAQFAGTWTGMLDGKTFARVELTETAGRISGRISLGAVHFGPSGDITEVNQPATNFTPIFDLAVRDGVLTFARKDGEETDRFELRLVDGAAQLIFVFSDADRAEFASQGVTNVKPMRLIKTK